MAAETFTGKKLGMDRRVWLVLLATCVLCLGLLGYREARRIGLSDASCAPAVMVIDGKRAESITVCYQNRFSKFELRIDTAAKVAWNFGDGTATFEGPVVSHRFSKEGSYKVTATVDSACRFVEEVIVVRPVDLGSPDQTLVEIYADSANPKVGSSVTFACASNIEATSYEWSLLGTDDVQHTPVATFTFNSPGKYAVQVVINNDPATATKRTIEAVLPAPEMPSFPVSSGSNAIPTPNIGPPPVLFPQQESSGKNSPQGNSGAGNPQGAANATSGPSVDTLKKGAKPPARDTDPATFMTLLQDVIDGNKEIQDLNEYLCYRSTKVQVNGKMPLQTLNAFCNSMRGKKNNKIESLSFVKDENKCIQTIQVKVQEKKGILKRIFNN